MADPKRVFDARLLAGGRIISAGDVPDHANPRDICTVFVVKNRGAFYHCEVWRDEEGNGPGHLYIEQTKV